MKAQTTLEKSNGAMPRFGNNVHARHIRDRDPHRLEMVQGAEAMIQSLTKISQTPQSNVTVLELP